MLGSTTKEGKKKRDNNPLRQVLLLPLFPKLQNRVREEEVAKEPRLETAGLYSQV